jgi:hypothetical protein
VEWLDMIARNSPVEVVNAWKDKSEEEGARESE